jgi:hypothetical protein
VIAKIREMICAVATQPRDKPEIKRKEKMLTSFLALFLKLITSPALLAGLIAFLQKSLHP